MPLRSFNSCIKIAFRLSLSSSSFSGHLRKVSNEERSNIVPEVKVEFQDNEKEEKKVLERRRNAPIMAEEQR